MDFYVMCLRSLTLCLAPIYYTPYPPLVKHFPGSGAVPHTPITAVYKLSDSRGHRSKPLESFLSFLFNCTPIPSAWPHRFKGQASALVTDLRSANFCSAGGPWQPLQRDSSQTHPSRAGTYGAGRMAHEVQFTRNETTNPLRSDLWRNGFISYTRQQLSAGTAR